MKQMTNKGFSLPELLVAAAIGGIVIYAIATISSNFNKGAKSLELKENTRTLIDKELLQMSKRAELVEHAEIKKHAEAVCNSLGLKYTYDPATKEFNCMVTKYDNCKNQSPCLVSIKESLCELQKRSKVTMRHACSL